MTEGPYYIVVKGTNQRFTSYGTENPDPVIYDTSDLAQKMIDHNWNSWITPSTPEQTEFEPISVAEYNKKYGELMGIKED